MRNRKTTEPTLRRIDREIRLDELNRWFRDQHDEFRGDAFPPEVQAAWDQHRAEADTHERVLAELAERDRRMIDGVRSGQYKVESGDGRRIDQGSDTDRSVNPAIRTARDQALRAIERVCSEQDIEDRSATRVENLIRHEDTQTGAGARWLAAVGSEDYRDAFIELLRDPTHGHLKLSAKQADAVRTVSGLQIERAMSVGTGSAGGFGIPIDLDPSIMSTGSGVVNPIREIADVRLTVGDIWKGVAADAPTAAYQAEAAEMADASPTLVQPSITTQRGNAFVPVSFEVLMDWPKDQLVSELRKLLNESKDNLDSGKWLTGTGSNEPGGILNIGGTGGLTTAQRIQTATLNTTVIADVYTFKQALANTKFYERSTWAFNSVIGDLFWRFVPSGSTTEPQIFDGGRGGPLLGRPVAEWSNMATTHLVTTTKIAILGDWSGFTIVDRLGSTVELIPHLFGAANRFPTGQRGVVYWWRSSSGVTKPNALRYLEVK